MSQRMSKFVVAVGGSGAKLMYSLLHLSAAGLIPEAAGGLYCLLVDPDENNGSGNATKKLSEQYRKCQLLQCGSTPLFKTPVALEGPWTPVMNQHLASLGTLFGYTQMRENSRTEADLMELLFTEQERDLPIFQGFRGRPAIGSAIFGRAVNFRSGEWSKLRDEVVGAASGQEHVPLLLTGSVFGGSGAAGVPTICRLLQQELKGAMKNVRLGLVLFLPYFQYKPVPNEEMQAQPETFAAATVESLKYYDEGRFLDICESIYAVGEEAPSLEPVSSVGGKDQVNEPHFLELVAALGAVRFMAGSGAKNTLSLAARKAINTVTWDDLPTAAETRREQIALLRSMILFAVAFRYCFFPALARELSKNSFRDTLLQVHLRDVSAASALGDLESLNAYLETFLFWLLKISTPAGLANFVPGLVKLSVFAVPEGVGWRLKTQAEEGRGNEFQADHLRDLFVNAGGLRVPSRNDLFRAAAQPVKDQSATGTGKLVRAIYDACTIS